MRRSHHSQARGRRWLVVLTALVAALAASVAAQEPAPELEIAPEIISPFLRIKSPEGHFPRLLGELSPPRGDSWHQVGKQGGSWHVMAPRDLPLDAEQAGSRLMRVALRQDPRPPRPVLSLHVHPTQEGEPTAFTPEIADEYIRRYLNQGIAQQVIEKTDSGLVSRGALRFAMVVGAYTQGAQKMRHAHFAFYSPSRQFYIRFDCADDEWAAYQSIVGQIFLSFYPEGP